MNGTRSSRRSITSSSPTASALSCWPADDWSIWAAQQATSFVMSNSFTNQTLAQIELFKHGDRYENKVYVLPKHLDEHVARMHLARVGARLTELKQEQADYIGVAVEGPYKPEHYRY